jgi:16S rRNA (cytosine967-C5)-methyltransferase
MTPAARLSAAIEILDQILSGTGVDPALTTWARGHRFAGSGDRAAIRDHVFDCLRCRRSFSALGGGMTGRGLILGLARSQGLDIAALFTGEAHAPPPVAPDESGSAPLPGAEAGDVPDWLYPRLQAALGPRLGPNLQALRQRAPIFLRVNTGKDSLATAIDSLAGNGIEAEASDLADTALMVTKGARAIATSTAYLEGLVELQDAASQAVINALPLASGMSVLDFCAGGGGKTLAMAARARLSRLDAHDISPARMKDLPARAHRAGARVNLLTHAPTDARYDLVLVDAPCSGSGSWRRDPMGKWRLTPGRLQELVAIQASILDQTAALVRPAGYLVYVTCSILMQENADQVAGFKVRQPAFQPVLTRQFLPEQGCDGFFLCLFQRMVETVGREV